MSTPTSFSSGPLSIYSLPSSYLCLGLPWPSCRTLHLALFNFMRFTQPRLSGLSASSGWHPFPPACHHASHLGVGRFAEGVLDPTVHVSNSCTGPGTNPWECHSWLVSTWILNHWPWLFECDHQASSLSIHWGLHLVNPCHCCLETRMLCKTVKCSAKVQVDDVCVSAVALS